MGEIDVIGNFAESNIRFILNTTLWDSFDLDILSIISHPKSWYEVKLLAPSGKKNPELRKIPNDKGGIYLFLAKPNILPESCVYLMYIGRAHITTTHNLRKRCSQYSTEKKRPKIKRMIEQWGQYLYCRYFPLDDNTIIDNVERELIKKILPPFNDEIPDQKISAAVKAFTM
jgi:excinuclease UvrABC nuclease subunit